LSAFYGDPARLSYFLGCSTGGRQGYVEAERYPQDFDGIVAGAPIMSEAEDDLTLFWNVLATLTPDGRQVFTPQALELLHSSVVEACDMNDGVKDGLIGDPRQCHFDPAVLQCRSTNASNCLNPEQIEAARRIYQGPVTSNGHTLSKAVVLPGSELNWRGAYVGANGEPAEFYSFIGDALRYLLFTPALGPHWDPRAIDWDHDPERVRTLESLYNAQNPDLRQFQARGGKLLGFHGWADHSSPPYFSTDYYDMVSRVMGGASATQSFYRLFMVPGMGHCNGGEGADRIDYLTYLQEWVEHEHAPERLIGQHAKTDDKQWLVFGRAPLAAPQVAFTRPMFPYPARTRYVGGDPAKADSFSAE
jgi:feruloyl esterase